MHSQRFFRSLVLVLVILVALAPTGAAFAAAPVVQYVEYDVDSILGGDPCPGMEVWLHEVITWRETTYFDNDGNIKSVKIHIVEGVDTLHNPANPGFVLRGEFGGNAEVDLQTLGWINASGILVHITFPGYGRVLMLTGHWVVYPTLHLGGLDSFNDPEDMAEFCSLLAGN